MKRKQKGPNKNKTCVKLPKGKGQLAREVTLSNMFFFFFKV